METKFAERFKLLRTSKKLSSREIANILNVKSTASIAFWENGRGIPSLSLFFNIPKLFGISADWLWGLIDEPYNETFIASIEDELKEILEKEIVNLYLGKEVINIERTLEQRANIIFWLQVLHFNEEKYRPFLINALVVNNAPRK